jgi:serine phosphatase RsbU (regulator of sigma subunit)
MIKGRIKTPGLFLGVSDSPEYEVYSLPIVKGDCFCFYSDGIADCLIEGRALPLGTGFAELVTAVRRIAADGVARDDATALCIKIGNLDSASK